MNTVKIKLMIHYNKICFQFAKRLVLLVLLIVVSNAVHAGGGMSHATHYSKATVTTSNGFGKVYVSTSNSAPNWNDATSNATATKDCGGSDNNDAHNHTYYFYAQNQSNWLWAGWEKDNVFVENSQNGTLTNDYYTTNETITAESDQNSSPTEVNMIALWWRPQITNTEIVGVTTNPKSEETVTITDPDITEIQRTVNFVTAEALSADNFTLTRSNIDNYTTSYDEQYSVDVTIPISGEHHLDPTIHTLTLTSKYKGDQATASSGTATIKIIEDYTPRFGSSVDTYEFVRGTETKAFSMEWLNAVAQHSNTTWTVNLVGDDVFQITNGGTSAAPEITFTKPASPEESYSATLTISCSYKGIPSNIIDNQGNELKDGAEIVHVKTIVLTASFEPTIVWTPSAYDFNTIECGKEVTSGNISLLHNLAMDPTVTISGNPNITFAKGEFTNKEAIVTVTLGSALPVGSHTATLTALGKKENGDPIEAVLVVTVNVVLQTPVLRGTPANEQVNLSWDKIPGATEYEITWSGNGNNGTITISDPNQTSYQHTGLTNNIPYTYTLTAYCNDKDQKTSNTVVVVPQYYPLYIAKEQTTYGDGTVAVAAAHTGLYTGAVGNTHELNVSAAFSGKETQFEWLYLFVAQTAQGKYPCYIYRRNTAERYIYHGQVEMTDNKKDKTYFELTTDIGSIYLAGYCGEATTGNTWTENGVLHIKKGSKNTIDLYLDGLQLYAKAKSSLTYSTTDATEVINNFVGKSYPMEGSGAIFVFDGRNGGFNPTLHVCNENILQSTRSMSLDVNADGTVESGWSSINVKFQMMCEQESSVIQAMVDGDEDQFAISITDSWHDLNNMDNTNGCRTNGLLTLQNKPETSTHPLINLGYSGSVLCVDGGQIHFNNTSDVCVTGAYQYLQRQDNISSYVSLTTYVYGCSNYSITSSTSENSGLQKGYGLKGEINQSMRFLDGNIHAAVSPLVCPANTTIDGGNYLCDVKAGTSTDLYSSYDTGKQHKLHKIAVDVVEPAGTIENGLVVFETTPNVDGKDGFQVLMDNLFPSANYRTTIDAQEVYASLADYYKPSTKYGHESLAPVGTKLYLMLPQDGSISSYTGWALCVPEVQKVNQNIGGGTQEVSAGGTTEVVPTTKVPVAESSLKLTNRLLYAEIDETTKEVIKELDLSGDDATVTIGHNITNTDEYTINDKVYMLLPVVAGQWKMLVAPFDVHNVYAIEAYPESLLKKVYGEEKRTGSGRYYITDIEGARNAQAKRLFDLLVYWMSVEDLDVDFFRAAGGYGNFVETWMNYEAANKEMKGGVEVDGDYTPKIEQLYHFTGTKGSYPNAMKWYEASYYLYQSDGLWEFNTETGAVETDWIEVTEQSVPRSAGTPNTIMHKGGFYSLQFPSNYSNGWDYWTGKYILLEGYGPQTIDGSSVINNVLPTIVNTPDNAVQLYGNASFANSQSFQHEYLYHTALNDKGVLDFVRKTDAKAFFAPMDGFAIGDLDGAVETITTAEGKVMQKQKKAKSINMKTGEVVYEQSTTTLDDNPGVATDVPTIMGDVALIVMPTETGLVMVPKYPQQVMIYDVEGKLIFNQYVVEEQSVALPSSTYIVRGEQDKIKVVKK